MCTVKDKDCFFSFLMCSNKNKKIALKLNYSALRTSEDRKQQFLSVDICFSAPLLLQNEFVWPIQINESGVCIILF